MIRGFFDPARGRYPFVTLVLRVAEVNLNRWFPLEFVLDTGAEQSCLHPNDAMQKMGVPSHRLDDSSTWPLAILGGGVGGGASFYSCRAQYGFVHKDGVETLIPGAIWVARLSATNRDLPSLLGRDVLQHFRLEIDGPNKTVSLHHRSGTSA